MNSLVLPLHWTATSDPTSSRSLRLLESEEPAARTDRARNGHVFYINLEMSSVLSQVLFFRGLIYQISLKR